MRVAVLLCGLTGAVLAAEDGALTTDWKILLRPQRGSTMPRDLPPAGAIQPLPEFQFTGPMPAHPFVLGNFVADGKFGMVSGGIQRIDGTSAAMRLAEHADQFEMEGQIHVKDLGGWFMLVGWNDETGNGYAIHNVAMKESGSPWFITELRGRKAVEDTNQQIKQFEWNRPQDVKISVKEGKLTFQLGAAKVLDGEPLMNYQPGQIIFGVYDTKYGPRPVRIESLRIRAVEPAAPAPPAAP